MVRRLLVVGIVFCAGIFAARAEPVFMDWEISPKQPYVQQQVQLTVRLYRDSPLKTGYFVVPEIVGAVVEELSATEPIAVMRDGVDMELLEKRFLLFPQASGTLTIPSIAFSGRDVFAKTETIELDVRPTPEGNDENWLPAQWLAVTEDWIEPDGELGVGKTIERRVAYEAIGLTAAQLPAQKVFEIEGIQVERLPPILEDRIESGQMVGRRTERVLLTPLVGGTLGTVSETITWWDVMADDPRYIHLPGRVFKIRGEPTPELEDEVKAETETSAEADEPAEPIVASQGVRLFAGIVAGCLVIVLLSWAAARWNTLHRDERARRKQVRAWAMASARKDNYAARLALLKWGEAVWPNRPPTGLWEMAHRFENHAFNRYVDALEGALYGPGTNDPALYEAEVGVLLKKANGKKRGCRKTELPPLNS